MGNLLASVRYYDGEDPGPGLTLPTYNFTISGLTKVDLQDLQDFLRSNSDADALNYVKAAPILALNVILAQTPNQKDNIFAFGGNRFYQYIEDKSLSERLDLGAGLIAVRGYYASVRTSTLRTLVNVHTQTSAFYPDGTVYSLMKLHGTGYDPEMPALRAFLLKLRIKTSYIKGSNGKMIDKFKVITGLSKLNARDQTFFDENDRRWTVQEYFLRTYNKTLDHPEAPVIQIGEIKKDKNGKSLPKGQEKPIWLPPELGHVLPGQIYSKKLSSSQTSAMLKYAARPPAENARRLVNDGCSLLELNRENETLVSSKPAPCHPSPTDLLEIIRSFY